MPEIILSHEHAGRHLELFFDVEQLVRQTWNEPSSGGYATLYKIVDVSDGHEIDILDERGNPSLDVARLEEDAYLAWATVESCRCKGDRCRC